MGWTTPVSLFAHWTETSVRSGAIARAISSSQTSPFESTGNAMTSRSSRASASATASADERSTAVVTSRQPSIGPPRRLCNAKLLASVAPPVNTTAAGSVETRAATCSLANHSRFLDRAPAA